MTLHEYGLALRRHWLVIACIALLGAALGWGASQLTPERFRSQASVMIVPARGESTSELVQGSSYVQDLVHTYAVLARSPLVLQPVIDRLRLPDTTASLAARTDVDAPLDTVVLELGVTDASPERAASIADAIAEEFAVAVAQISPDDSDGDPAVRVSVIAPARAGAAPIAPNTRLNVLVGGAGGLAVGLVTALLLRRFGNRIDSTEGLRESSAAPVLGSVGRAGSEGLVVTLRERPSGRIAESVRQTTAALTFLDPEQQHRVLLVSSASAGEGKSSVSAGIAMTLAEIGHRVLLIEADMRRPSLADAAGIEGNAGLTSVLLGRATIEETAQVWAHEHLHLLSSGPKPPDPSPLLTSRRLHALLEDARARFDYVVLDSPPVLAVSDALWLAASADASIVIARSGRTRRDSVRRAVEALDATPAPVIGLVLNGVPLAKSAYDRSSP